MQTFQGTSDNDDWKEIENALNTGNRANPSRRDSGDVAKSAEERVDGRGEEIEHLLTWLRQAAFCMVNDWHELFAVGRKHKWFVLAQSEGTLTGAHKKDLDDYRRDCDEGLRFYDRCEHIYTEEMAPVDLLAAEARERIAKRIEHEFPRGADGIPQALRENDPQKWASEIDWS